MESAKAVLLLVTILAFSSVSRGEHPLDEAGHVLATGDVLRAAQIYRQAVGQEPSAEGYNNLGIALEHAGQFIDAVDAYENAVLLHDADVRIDANLKRARLRALIQLSLPYAACTFAGLLGAILFFRLVRRLARLWQHWLYRIKIRHVCIRRLTHRVQCSNGRYEPDGRIYPDAQRLSVEAELVLPGRQDIYPLHLELQIISPNGAVWRSFRKNIEAQQQMTVSFEIDPIAEVLANSGTWNIRLVLQNTDRCLSLSTLIVVSHADLVGDLQATNVRLLAVQADQTAPETVIFPDVESVIPTAEIRPKTFCPSKFTGMRLRLDLVNVDKQDDVESQEFALEFADGVLQFCSVSHPIAGNEIAHQLGRWEFRFSVEGRQIARIRFAIISVQQALESLTMEAFDVVGVPIRGTPSPIGNVAYIRNLRSVCPMVRISSKLASPKAGFRMTIGVCVDDEPVGGLEGTLVISRSVVELVPGEFTLPQMADGRDSIRISFVLLVEGRNLGIRELTILAKAAPCADAQGRIIRTPSTSDIDYGREAARILHEARVA